MVKKITQPTSSSDRSLISFIVVGRNDNYGGHFLERLQVFIDTLRLQCAKHELSSEIIIVEWNPPRENLGLSEVVKISESIPNVLTKIIRVPPEIHNRFNNAEKMKLFEYAGKNVGIRRATGKYILATNPDIIFSDELVHFLATDGLSDQNYYRSVRYDIKSQALLDSSLDEKLAYCKNNIIKINDYTHTHRGGLSRFGLMAWYYHLRLKLSYWPYPKPFTNASGDFLMMHRDKWFELHGYPEISGVDSDGMPHTDSMMVHMALFYGLRQVNLRKNQRIYHQEHGSSLSSRPFAPEVKETRQKFKRDHKPLIYNDDSWGLPDVDLSEIDLG